jgi:MFS family permease
VLGIATGGAAALGPVLGGLLASAFSGTYAVLVCAGGIAAVAVVATLSPTLRSFPKQLVTVKSPGIEPGPMVEIPPVRSADRDDVVRKGD